MKKGARRKAPPSRTVRVDAEVWLALRMLASTPNEAVRALLKQHAEEISKRVQAE